MYSVNLDETARFGLEAAPQQHFARYVFGCIQELRKIGVAVPTLDICIDSDVPIGVGLSSSASLEVAMLRAISELNQLALDPVLIAQLAQRAEIDYAGVNCGILDQMAASLLEPGSMLFLDTRTLASSLLPLPPATELLVIDSGVSRSLAASQYNERRQECEEAARRLDVSALRDAIDDNAVARLPGPLRRRAQHVISETRRVLTAAVGVDAETFGQLMNASHRSLSDAYEVSTRELDALAELLAQHASVYGAKLTGAGFGGACVALCRRGRRAPLGTKSWITITTVAEKAASWFRRTAQLSGSLASRTLTSRRLFR